MYAPKFLVLKYTANVAVWRVTTQLCCLWEIKELTGEALENNESTILHRIKFVKDVITPNFGTLLRNWHYARI